MFLLYRLVEDTLQVSLCERGALQVFHRLDILRDLYCLLVLYWRHLSLPELLSHFWIVSKIEFCAYKDDRYSRRVVLYFGVPLVKYELVIYLQHLVMARIPSL